MERPCSFCLIGRGRTLATFQLVVRAGEFVAFSAIHRFGTFMDYVIRPLTAADEALLWKMLQQGLQTAEDQSASSLEISPELARYVEGWGRPGDTGFVANDAEEGQVLGAVWLRTPIERSSKGAAEDVPLELAFAVAPGQRGHGIGTALLTQLVRSNPEASTISIGFAAGKPVLRLYERFGFKVVEQGADAIVMRREA